MPPLTVFHSNPYPFAALTEKQLREILYDCVVRRRMPEADDYEALSDKALPPFAEYNKVSRANTLAIGRLDPLSGLWNSLLPDLRDRGLVH